MTDSNPSCGDAAAQSLQYCVAGSRLARFGARFHETNVAPAASASGRLHDSLMNRTRWPRAMSLRATTRAGVTLPPPSQVVNRKFNAGDMVSFSFRILLGAGVLGAG